jgi:hypothetical protein
MENEKVIQFLVPHLEVVYKTERIRRNDICWGCKYSYNNYNHCNN